MLFFPITLVKFKFNLYYYQLSKRKGEQVKKAQTCRNLSASKRYN